jgi:hypothetical protein
MASSCTDAFAQESTASSKIVSSTLPPLEVGKSIPKEWSHEFKNDSLREWIARNVVCQRQPVPTDLGISAGEQLLITPEVFNRQGYADKQRINLLAFELGKTFYAQALKRDESLSGWVSKFATDEMEGAEYRETALMGDTPRSLHLADLDTASKFSYVFRVELLGIHPGTCEQLAHGTSCDVWDETIRHFRAIVDPIVRTPSLSDNANALSTWSQQTREFISYMENEDAALARAHRWRALLEWTGRACGYMSTENVFRHDASVRFATEEAEYVPEDRTYLRNTYVVLEDAEIASGLAQSGASLSRCQESLIGVIRTASAPIDVTWFLEQFDRQRAAYNDRLEAERKERLQRFLNTPDPVLEALKSIGRLVSGGAAKLVAGIAAPFLFIANPPAAPSDNSARGSSSRSDDNHPTMGPTYQQLRGVAASGNWHD